MDKTRRIGPNLRATTAAFGVDYKGELTLPKLSCQLKHIGDVLPILVADLTVTVRKVQGCRKRPWHRYTASVLSCRLRSGMVLIHAGVRGRSSTFVRIERT